MSLTGTKKAVTGWSAASWLVAVAAIGTAPAAQAQTPSDSGEGRWELRSAAHVDLWYHGLAVVGFDQEEGLPLYNAEYAERVRAAKQALGVFPTLLDSRSEELRKEFQKDPAFQQLHFLPLSFPEATRTEMHRALMIVAERQLDSLRTAGRSTRTGIRLAAGMFDSGNQRKRLRQFLEALEQEWAVFYAQYWDSTVAADSARFARLQRRWDDEIAPAASEFLERHKLTAGQLFVTPALGPEGRLQQGSSVRRTPHVVAAWDPGWDDLDASLFAAVREMCFAVVDDALRAAGQRDADQELTGRAAVQCGALVFEETAVSLAEEYQRTFLRAADPEASYSDPTLVAAAFERVFEVEESLADRLRQQVQPNVRIAERRRPAARWTVQPRTQADLWFHALAVIQADQPGPLGLYSADYASQVRTIKQELGVYPTLLDSLAPRLREAVADEDSDVMHFVPLYFPRVNAERMLEVLKAVARRRSNDPRLVGQDVRNGVAVMFQVTENGRARRLLEDLVEAMENEWNVFFRDYVKRLHTEQESRYAAIQSMWDSLFVPQLGPYLERRRLNAGTVFPSPALGPEGRIVDLDGFAAGDQVVAVQLPLATSAPSPSVFAFLKELCFLIVDDRMLLEHAEDAEDLEDMRRRAAVRCGHMLLELYAPILVGSYRRVFLDAVGAEESSTVAAFERVYPLSPEVLERVRGQIRGS